ncbi:activating transcription factor 3 [Hydra vulgaris]|uniref:activating transcription factor 3 n=1 Tax=Hydra vulgaris TaxID=6087 RepID=UPI0006416D72|nr:activating transcription factor 3 [Hydra vulgaris]
MNEETGEKNTKSKLRNVLKAKLLSNDGFEENEANKIDDTDSESCDSDNRANYKDASNTPLEERRIRNRLAARKCREKRKQRIWNLEKICSSLEERISALHKEIAGLDNQKSSLSKLLQNHACCRFVTSKNMFV